MRIYNDSQSVPYILELCKNDNLATKSTNRDPTDISHIELDVLSRYINRFPAAEIRDRRRNYNILYEEAMMSASERGISFTAMLLMVAHYKFIDENKALRYPFYTRD